MPNSKASLLILLALVAQPLVSSEPLNLEGILRTEQNAQALTLRMQQQRQRSNAENLSASKLRQMNARQFKERMDLNVLKQHQLREHRLLHRRLLTKPSAGSRSQQHLQMQRFRQDRAIQQLHFKLLRDFK
jgi:hypothetical protein